MGEELTKAKGPLSIEEIERGLLYTVEKKDIPDAFLEDRAAFLRALMLVVEKTGVAADRLIVGDKGDNFLIFTTSLLSLLPFPVAELTIETEGVVTMLQISMMCGVDDVRFERHYEVMNPPADEEG